MSFMQGCKGFRVVGWITQSGFGRLRPSTRPCGCGADSLVIHILKGAAGPAFSG